MPAQREKRPAKKKQAKKKKAPAKKKRFPGRWIGKLVVQALPKEEVRQFKDVGVQIYHPNYEVWDPKLFEIICPGKEKIK